MGTVVNLDPDVEELIRREARSRNVEFDCILNEVVRVGLSSGATSEDNRTPFVQKTYPIGPPRVDLTMALADELEDEERIQKIRLVESR